MKFVSKFTWIENPWQTSTPSDRNNQTKLLRDIIKHVFLMYQQSYLTYYNTLMVDNINIMKPNFILLKALRKSGLKRHRHKNTGRSMTCPPSFILEEEHKLVNE